MTMNTIEKLNNIINNIEASRERRKSATGISFDDIDLDVLNLEIVVGSKVNIQSEKESFNLSNNLLLENYLKSISRYRKYKHKSPKYSLNTLDLDLNINLEINQKVLVKKPKKLKKTPEDIKRDINITLLENLKTSIFLYNNIHKVQRYKAKFDDLHMDIELEYVKKKVNKSSDKFVGKETHISVPKPLGDKEIKNNRVAILKEKLDNIKKFKEREKFHSRNSENDLDINVTVTKTGEQLISLSKRNKIKKLEQLLESISSYKERRNEF